MRGTHFFYKKKLKYFISCIYVVSISDTRGESFELFLSIHKALAKQTLAGFPVVNRQDLEWFQDKTEKKL